MDMQEVKVTIDEDGNVSIPIEFRQELGIQSGDEVVLQLESDVIRITTTRNKAVRQVQTLIRQYVPVDRQLSEELIQERRKESQRE